MKVDDRFVSLYQAEYGAILRATYLLCRDRGLAEDATQEAFARAFERWSRLQHHDWVAGWIMTTALNYVRRAKRSRELPPTPSGPTVDLDEKLDVWSGIRSLSRRQREVVILHYAMGFPLNQISELLGCSKSTTKTHLARARKTLENRLETQSNVPHR